MLGGCAARAIVTVGWSTLRRGACAFNDGLDRAALRPTRAPTRRSPHWVRTGVGSFTNLSYPGTIVNPAAGKIVAAEQNALVVLNTTIRRGPARPRAYNLPIHDEISVRRSGSGESRQDRT
jgi:hypothetical protein